MPTIETVPQITAPPTSTYTIEEPAVPTSFPKASNQKTGFFEYFPHNINELLSGLAFVFSDAKSTLVFGCFIFIIIPAYIYGTVKYKPHDILGYLSKGLLWLITGLLLFFSPLSLLLFFGYRKLYKRFSNRQKKSLKGETKKSTNDSSKNANLTKVFIDDESLFEPQTTVMPNIDYSTSDYSENNIAHDVCKFIWICSNIFSNHLQNNAPLRTKTYIWTSFFYVITKSVRKQVIVDEIYTQFLLAAACFIENNDEYNNTLDSIQSDYRTFREILNASGIDPRTSDGMEALWKTTCDFVFSGIEIPNNAFSGFRYNANLLANHVLIKYRLKKSETIYLLESKNGMTVRVPESKLETWMAAQESDTSRTSEDQRKALAKRIVHDIYHPNDK